jgi:molybdenum cofactor synthesis domain-containing protein
MTKANPTAAILVIGDEILSGRTRDANMHFLAQELTAIGIDLKEVRVVADDTRAIVAAVNALRPGYTHIFTSGGIGPTHDDITADAIALAFGVGINVRDDARAILKSRYDSLGYELTEARLRMARIPDTAGLINNPVSGAPGFSIGNVHVMAGVPSIFQAMVVGLLPKLSYGTPLINETLRIDHGESTISEILAQVAKDFPELSIGSYPFQQDGKFGTNIVFRGSSTEKVRTAVETLKRALVTAGL